MLRRRIALMLCLAIATTIAVAWAGAFFERASGATGVTEVLAFNNFTSECYRTRGLVITRNYVTWRLDPKVAALNPSWIVVATAAGQARTPRWSAAWNPIKPIRPPGTWGAWPHDAELDELAAGWPFRALYCNCDEATPDPVTNRAVYPRSRGGFTLPCHIIKNPKGSINVFLPRAIPCQPIAAGFAADVAFFSLVWSPLALSVLIRRAIRARRGQCLLCGYDRQKLTPDAPCPECGRSDPHESASRDRHVQALV